MKNTAPQRVDERAAKHRPQRRGQGREPSPGTDRFAALFLGKSRGDDGEAFRHQQRAADALHGARSDQDRRIRRQAAGYGCQCEQHRAEHEDAASPETIARRAADEDQCAEQQEIGVDHPLRRRDRHRELGLDRGQRDRDDRRVDERHAGAEDRRRQHPWPAAYGANAVAVGRRALRRHPR
jgi:hypothetical protein